MWNYNSGCQQWSHFSIVQGDWDFTAVVKNSMEKVYCATNH